MTNARFAGKVAMVTGSAQGIKLATARRMAEEGAKVFGMDINKPTEEVEGVTSRSPEGIGDSVDMLRATMSWRTT
jgi:NAD(P)-dependent dehydrogenase (short-subunit alcohol dehydrogenase family)